MMIDGPILVGLDGSERAEAMLGPAQALANALGTHLILVSVYQPDHLPARKGELERLGRDYFLSYLSGLRTRLGHPETGTIVRVGDPGSEVMASADELGAGLIAITTHGRSGISRWMYGSTASNLLHSSRVPLVVMGPNNDRAASVRAIQHIMVPLDGSAVSEGALDTAVQLRDATGAKISLVRVVKWAVEAYPYTLPAAYVPELDTALDQGAREYLDRQRETLGGDVSTHVIRGATADSLIDFVDDKDVDLVVMSTHGRGGIARAALGSTADRVLQANAPVLLVPTRRPEDSRPSLEKTAFEQVLA